MSLLSQICSYLLHLLHSKVRNTKFLLCYFTVFSVALFGVIVTNDNANGEASSPEDSVTPTTTSSTTTFPPVTTPTPYPCIDPTAPLLGGVCSNGRIRLDGPVFRAQNQNQCVIDPQCDVYSVATFDCTNNHRDRCQDCSTACRIDCPFYAFTVQLEGYGGNARNIYNPPPVRTWMSDQMDAYVRDAANRCLLIYSNPDPNSPYTVNNFDDCVAWYFLGRSSTFNNPAALGAFFGPVGSFIAAWMRGPAYWADYSSGVLYFSTDGTMLSTPPSWDRRVCDTGSINWRATPISLLWTEDADVDENITIVRFPLDPTEQDKWFLWKASAKTPLLVYDPTHRGVIKSAAQLFGNWTFGGKRFASTDRKSTISSEWRDGYEALSSLDHNHDNKISGIELEPLGLWFDGNQDGISQAGEVKPITEVGILALYTAADWEEKATKNLIALHGYDRVVNAKIIHGVSVDWRSASADTKDELIDRHLTTGLVKAEIDKPSVIDVDSTDVNVGKNISNSYLQNKVSIEPLKDNILMPQGRQKAASANPSEIKDISGLWYWKSEDLRYTEEETPKGVFTFSKKEDGKIQGHSYFQLHLNKPKDNVESMLSIMQLSGVIEEGIGLTKVRFQNVNIEDERVQIENEAVLSFDGLSLDGKSRVTTTYHGKPVTIAYPWKAWRVKL